MYDDGAGEPWREERGGALRLKKEKACRPAPSQSGDWSSISSRSDDRGPSPSECGVGVGRLGRHLPPEPATPWGDQSSGLCTGFKWGSL